MSPARRRRRPLTAAQRQAMARAIPRREAREQTRELLERMPRCPHGRPVRICPACQRTPLEEVPF